MTELTDRLRAHERGMRMRCICASTLPNCMACDCGVAADEIDRLTLMVEATRQANIERQAKLPRRRHRKSAC